MLLIPKWLISTELLATFFKEYGVLSSKCEVNISNELSDKSSWLDAPEDKLCSILWFWDLRRILSMEKSDCDFTYLCASCNGFLFMERVDEEIGFSWLFVSSKAFMTWLSSLPGKGASSISELWSILYDPEVKLGMLFCRSIGGVGVRVCAWTACLLLLRGVCNIRNLCK